MPEESKKEENPEEKLAIAEEILAKSDCCGMDLEKAEKVLSDDSCTEEEKDDADALLAAADTGCMDMKEAEKLVGECASSGSKEDSKMEEGCCGGTQEKGDTGDNKGAEEPVASTEEPTKQ